MSEITKKNGCWLCPYCLKNFENRKSNLKNHIQSQIRKKILKHTGCSKKVENTNIKILRNNLMSLKYKKHKKVVKKSRKCEIWCFDNCSISTKYLDDDWSLYTLEEIVFKLIKATYLSDYRYKQNCIATYGQYFKIKQRFAGKSLWKTKIKYLNVKNEYKCLNLTKSKFTIFIIRKVLNFLIEKHPAVLKELLKHINNKEFHTLFMEKTRCPEKYSNKMKLMFLKAQHNKKKKITTTTIIEFSSDSEEDIEFKNKSGLTDIQKYKLMEEDEHLMNLVDNVLQLEELNYESDIIDLIKQVPKAEHKEFIISKLGESSLKNSVIKVFCEEYINNIK